MGRRSRKRRAEPAPAKPVPAKPAPAAAGPSRSERSEARNAAVRAQLEPLAPGERPLAVTVGSVVAFVLAVANIVLWAVGVGIKGQHNSASGIIVFAGLMVAMGLGMWQARYWAVLGFQALLALTVLIAALSLTVASNLAAVALSASIVVLGGALFWFMVKAMARIQMPERRPSRPS